MYMYMFMLTPGKVRLCNLFFSFFFFLVAHIMLWSRAKHKAYSRPCLLVTWSASETLTFAVAISILISSGHAWLTRCRFDRSCSCHHSSAVTMTMMMINAPAEMPHVRVQCGRPSATAIGILPKELVHTDRDCCHQSRMNCCRRNDALVADPAACPTSCRYCCRRHGDGVGLILNRSSFSFFLLFRRHRPCLISNVTMPVCDSRPSKTRNYRYCHRCTCVCCRRCWRDSSSTRKRTYLHHQL